MSRCEWLAQLHENWWFDPALRMPGSNNGLLQTALAGSALRAQFLGAPQHIAGRERATALGHTQASAGLLTLMGRDTLRHGLPRANHHRAGEA